MLKKAKYKIYKNEDYIVEVQKRETDETRVDFWFYNIHYGAKRRAAATRTPTVWAC